MFSRKFDAKSRAQNKYRKSYFMKALFRGKKFVTVKKYPEDFEVVKTELEGHEPISL